MKLVPIFVSDNSQDSLWSIHLDGQPKNEFDRFFDLMNNVEWLHAFLVSNMDDLHSGFFGHRAIKSTHDMKRGHLQTELKKLEQTKRFLRNNGINYPEDLNTYRDE